MFFWGKKKWSAGFFDGFQDLSGCASGQSLPLALSPGPHPPAWKLGEITTSSVQQTIFLRFLRLLLKFSFNFGKEVVGCRSLWGILCDSHPDPMHHSGPQLPGQWGKCWPANGESQGSKPFTRQLQQLPGWNLHIFKKNIKLAYIDWDVHPLPISGWTGQLVSSLVKNGGIFASQFELWPNFGMISYFMAKKFGGFKQTSTVFTKFPGSPPLLGSFPAWNCEKVPKSASPALKAVAQPAACGLRLGDLLETWIMD